MDAWFDRLESGTQTGRPVMAVDYDLYAEGEALLGWLNATVGVTSSSSFDPNALLRGVAAAICQRLGSAEIAHLKITFTPDEGLGDIAAVSLVRSDFIPELSLVLDGPATSGQLIVNVRAEAEPAQLRSAVESTVAGLGALQEGVSGTLEHAEQFRPGRPSPTHRDAAFEVISG
jgi:hypothetical protein